MAATVLDACGRQCPIPVVLATKAISAMTEPGLLEVLVDNEVAVQNLLRMASGKGFAAKSEKTAADRFTVTIDVDKPGAGGEEKQQEAVCAPDLKGNTVVVIGADTMGIGNDELGGILIKGFIYALSQQEELPASILFYNGGVRLTTEGSPCLEDLRTLESEGVEILSCGTCLDFYGLKE